MPDRSLMVMIPTRGRRKLAERCLKSYADTVSLETTEAVFVTDGDDRLTYEGMDSRARPPWRSWSPARRPCRTC